jgi:hypothetical protein
MGADDVPKNVDDSMPRAVRASSRSSMRPRKVTSPGPRRSRCSGAPWIDYQQRGKSGNIRRAGARLVSYEIGMTGDKPR